jgi:acyl-CoA thioesterase I
VRALVAALATLLLAGCTGTGHGTPRPSAGAPTVVALGDSVPAGTACGCTPFPDLYARLLAPGATSTNLAEPGYTSGDVRQQLASPAARAAVRAADVVLVMAGANDVAAAFDPGGASYETAATTVERNIAAAVAAIHVLRGRAVPVLVLGYWNIVEDGDVGRADYGPDGVAEARSATLSADEALMRAAAATGARYVDTTAAFEGDDGEQDPTPLLAPDGDHPDAAGHEAIAEAAYAVLPGR